jgi:hypothetical protein
MNRRLLVVIVVATCAVGAAGDRLQAGGQASAASPPRWTPPRTPWGDPDLQGVYTNSNEYATPLERPAEFTGRRLDELTQEELSKAREKATRQAIAGLLGGQVRGPDEWWLQNLDLAKRNQPWLIVDPPDGHVPALTPDAKVRLQGMRTRSSFVGGSMAPRTSACSSDAFRAACRVR